MIINDVDKDLQFDINDEEFIKKLTQSIQDKVKYDLRRIIGISDGIRSKAVTDEVNQWGDYKEDWSRVKTEDMIDALAAGAAWNFFSTPVRMNAFIESSLAEVVYKDEYNRILTSSSNTGTAAVKTANAELETEETNFKYMYRKMYTKAVEEMLKSFELFLKRLESIIWMRQRDEKVSPFSRAH